MMNRTDLQFHSLYYNLLHRGHVKPSRTGHGTLMLPAQTMTFDCRDGKIPIFSLRHVPSKSFMHEMLMFVSGTSSIKYLRDKKVGVWDSWFIKGTDVYDEPLAYKLDLDTRLQKAVDAGYVDTLIEFIRDAVLESGPSLGSTHITIRWPDGDGEREQNYNNCNLQAVGEINAFLDTLGIPSVIMTGGGDRISLKRRLGRVSKNDSEKWDQINALLASPGFDDPIVDHVVAPGQVTVFTNGAFVDTTVSSLMGAAVWQLLDDLKVPAYELLDADIGAGSYAPQWRKWQDTQMVHYADTVLRDEYLKQGYVQKGYMYGDDGGNGDDAFIMHREIDQLQNAIDMLKTNPDDRRIIVTAWNPGRTWQAALPPCHLYFQFTTWPMTLPELETTIKKHDKGGEYLRLSKGDAGVNHPNATNEDYFFYAMKFCEAADLPTRNLSLTLVLRSSDAPLGAVFNVAQYAMLLHMVAHVVNMEPHTLTTLGVDTHIYANQVGQMRQVLDLKTPEGSEPRLLINTKVECIDDFDFEDFEIVGYVPGPKIDIPVAV